MVVMVTSVKSFEYLCIGCIVFSENIFKSVKIKNLRDFSSERRLNRHHSQASLFMVDFCG